MQVIRDGAQSEVSGSRGTRTNEEHRLKLQAFRGACVGTTDMLDRYKRDP